MVVFRVNWSEVNGLHEFFLLEHVLKVRDDILYFLFNLGHVHLRYNKADIS